jgi:hypothetical protein
MRILLGLALKTFLSSLGMNDRFFDSLGMYDRFFDSWNRTIMARTPCLFRINDPLSLSYELALSCAVSLYYDS